MLGQPTLVELLRQADERKAQGAWYPACGGTERPFLTRNGFRLQYMWQPSSGRHAYINCDTDIIMSDEDAQAAIGI